MKMRWWIAAVCGVQAGRNEGSWKKIDVLYFELAAPPPTSRCLKARLRSSSLFQVQYILQPVKTQLARH